jgi:hypothetical protein
MTHRAPKPVILSPSSTPSPQATLPASAVPPSAESKSVETTTVLVNGDVVVENVESTKLSSEPVVNSKPLILSKTSVVEASLDGQGDASCKYIPTPNEELLLEQLAKLKASHAKQLKEAKSQARREAFAAKVPTLKVSAKGCVQINGIRRFPITLYKNEWEKIFEMLPDIKEFIKVNDESLTSI